jgi:hypothetical protein
MQPWFGLNEAAVTMAQSQVRPASNSSNFLVNGQYDALRGAIGLPLFAGELGTDPVVCSAEGAINASTNAPIWTTSAAQGSKRVYHAVFGFNQEDPGQIDPLAFGRGPYTPLPSAIRITMRLHDPLGRLEGGRDYQFIVELPKR